MRRPIAAIILSLSLAVTACGDSVTPESEPIPAPTLVAAVAASAPAGQALSGLVVDASAPDVTVTLTVTRGGGEVGSREVTTAEDGTVAVDWILGVAPVDNTLIVEREGALEALEITVRATLDAPWRAEPFADVNGFLDDEGHAGSTEDLTFTADGLVMGAPEGLLHVAPDGTITRTLSDDTLSRVWGFAVDADGLLWAVDLENKRLVTIESDGTVEEILTTNGTDPLEGANYVAIDHAGVVYLSDPCLGQIIRYEPDSGATTVHQFDLATEGGPNGLAVSADGTELYIATESTGILCQTPDIDIQAEIAGVYVIDIADFETHRPLAEGIGLFGDGLAFDAEGNLYVVVDKEENFQLEQSAIVVFPRGESQGVPFLEADENTLFANVAFGQGDYGATTLYIALLSIPPFTTADSRGLERFDVGIGGQPLLP